MGGTFYSKRLPNRLKSNRKPRNRPKTFKSREKAEAYAKEHGIKDYTITELSTHKYRIDKKE